MYDIARLQKALKEMWSKLAPEERAKLEKQAIAGHEYLLSIRSGAAPEMKAPVPRELLLLYSLLHDDPDGLLKDAASLDSEVTHVGADGEVYFGNVDFDSTDPKWAYCPWAWYETGPTVPFAAPPATPPAVVEIPDTATLAILGDWGGNNAPAQQVAAAVRNIEADYFVHLGDVYYAGTNENGLVETNYQEENFLGPWPGTSGKSFNLNSNHDMYAHAIGYFNTALASPMFSAQAGCSYFALFNSSFRFVGLDTAYFDPDQSGTGFMTGNLNSGQEEFLLAQARSAAQQNQKLILFTHHNGLSMDGETKLSLWNQIVAQLTPLNGQSVIWYCGHEHVGAVYQPQTAGQVTILPRCCGHGCIPWGIPSNLQGKSQVLWFEDEVLGPGSNYFVTNGFATLSLNGASITETFYNQSGDAHWTS
ncbi:MAG: metallophosphoesterase family protein [Calditrichia bacterium]